MSVNRVFLLGNVGADPEVRSLQGGGKVATIRVATSEKYKDRNGESHEQTEWHTVVVWNKPAEFVETYVKKGSTVFVEGKLTTRQWEDRSGGKRYSTEVKAESIQLVGAKKESSSSQAGDEEDMPDFMR